MKEGLKAFTEYLTPVNEEEFEAYAHCTSLSRLKKWTTC